MYSPADLERFWLRVTPGDPDECWPWLNGRCKGYGKFYAQGKLLAAHRVSWEIANGCAMQKELQAMHLCNRKNCVNPSHIKPGTGKENIRAAVVDGLKPMGKEHHNGKKTHCKHGHEYTPENTLRWTSGRRQCLECACQRLSMRNRETLRERQKQQLATHPELYF